MPGVAAEVPNVLVAADSPEARRALVDRVLGTELRQHVEVVVPEEKGGVPGVDPGEVDPVPLVDGHAASVLCAGAEHPASAKARTTGA